MSMLSQDTARRLAERLGQQTYLIADPYIEQLQAMNRRLGDMPCPNCPREAMPCSRDFCHVFNNAIKLHSS